MIAKATPRSAALATLICWISSKAVAVLFDHGAKSPHLTLDAGQALNERALLGLASFKQNLPCFDHRIRHIGARGGVIGS